MILSALGGGKTEGEGRGGESERKRERERVEREYLIQTLHTLYVYTTVTSVRLCHNIVL